MHGGELVANTLAAAGVRTLFTLVGGHTTPIVDACEAAGVRLVDVRHEEAAAHMAHAWARATGEPGVALVTAGPGVTNTVTGIANAWYGGAPVLLLAGAAPLPQLDRGALHEIDQLSLLRPITKWAARVHDVRRLPEYVTRGLATAAAAKLAFPGRQAVALLGDGAFGLGAIELDTAARLGLELLVVVSCNGAWAIETTSQQMEFGRDFATRLERRPYHELARSLGCDGIEVERPGDLAEALRTHPRGRPLLVNVQTDPGAHSPDAVRGLGLVPRDQAVEF